MAEQRKSTLLSLLAPPGWLASAERPAANERTKVEQNAEDQAIDARNRRWLGRLKTWAMEQDAEDLADYFAANTLFLIEMRRTARARDAVNGIYRELNNSLQMRSDAAMDVARDFARENAKTRADRKRGVDTRLANDKDGKQAAKKAIRAWWSDGAAICKSIPSGAEFDRQAVGKYPAITDTETVKGWRIAWKKEKQKGG